MYKKRDARIDGLAELLFCSNKPFEFLTFQLPSPSHLRKVPMYSKYPIPYKKNSLNLELKQ